MPEDIGSTVPRRQLGRLLRQFRNEAGVTLDAAAEALEYSRQKIWRLECGQGSVRVLDVKAMCELYGVSPEMTEAMRGLARRRSRRAGGTRTGMRCRTGSSCTWAWNPPLPASGVMTSR